MRLAPTALAALLSELGRLAVGGVIQVYAGEPPARLGETPQTATLLAELRVNTAALVADGVGLTAGDARGQATGTPRWFQVRAPGGSVLQDGDVGDGPGQLSIKPSFIARDGLVKAAQFVIGWGT